MLIKSNLNIKRLFFHVSNQSAAMIYATANSLPFVMHWGSNINNNGFSSCLWFIHYMYINYKTPRYEKGLTVFVFFKFISPI